MKALNKLLTGIAFLAAAAGTSTVSAFQVDETWNDFYFENAAQNRGLTFQIAKVQPEQHAVFVAYFTFDETSGEPFWVVGVGFIEAGEFSVDIPLSAYSGGSFGATLGSPVEDAGWGNMTITFNSCNSISVDWASDNVTDGSLEMVNQVALLGRGAALSKCVYQTEFTACPDGTTAAPGLERTCILEGTYTQDLVLPNNAVYLLSGGVFIGDKDSGDNTNSLRIEPGTRIVGAIGETPLLGISRGAKIYAQGLPHAPIVFTGPNTFSQGGAAGDWGGLTINGNAPLNECSTPGCAQGEGGSGGYGGDDPNDSSGVLEYVRVQYAGKLFTDENELNGIAFQGVGRGTVVENVQVHANADDGVEFFGGTVNVRNIVLTDIGDDELDWTQGWTGRVQNLLAIRTLNTTLSGDPRAIEGDNLSDNNDAEPRAKPWISHATFIGIPESDGAVIRRGSGANITNTIFTGADTCIDIDSGATFTAAGTPAAPTGVLTFENVIVGGCATDFSDGEEGDPYLVSDFFRSSAFSGNMEMDPALDGIFPPEDATYTSGFDINMERFDPFFNNYDHIGAFPNDKAPWTTGWAEFLP